LFANALDLPQCCNRTYRFRYSFKRKRKKSGRTRRGELLSSIRRRSKS